VTRVRDRITPNLQKAKGRYQRLSQDFLKVVKLNTPRHTGAARRKTQLTHNRTRVHANYPYAVPLDEGHSKQAPNGFIQPSLDWLKNEIDNIMKGSR
jgi:hypothetical protein